MSFYRTLNNLASSLRGSARLSYAGKTPLVTVVSDIESVSDYVGDGDVTALIISENISSIETGTETTISKTNITEWKEKYPEMLVILLVDSNRKGGVKLAKLFETGYFDALFYSDFKTNAVIDLIQNHGRDEAKAKKYYGLEDSNGFSSKEKSVRQAAPVEEEKEEYIPKEHSKKKKSSLRIAPSLQEDDDYEEDEEDVFEEQRSRKSRTKKKNVRDDYDEYDEYDEEDEEDVYEDEYEEEEPEPPRRRKKYPRRPRKQHLYPMPDNARLYFGKVEDLEDDVLYVKVSLKDDRTILDESFIGSDVFFVVSTEEP